MRANRATGQIKELYRLICIFVIKELDDVWRVSQEKKIKSWACVRIERGLRLITISDLDRRKFFMYVFFRYGDVVFEVRATNVVIV